MQPQKFTTLNLQNWATWGVTRTGRYLPSRPFSFQSAGLIQRLRLAWGVFVGRYDALDWEEPPILKVNSKRTEQEHMGPCFAAQHRHAH